MLQERKRIFIGAPIYGKVDVEVLEDWMRLAYHCGRRMPQYDFKLGIVPKKEQFRARNAIVDGALQTGCDYLLMLDDDMIINWQVTTGDDTGGDPDAYGFIERLIQHDKDVIGALYYQREGECSPVLMKAVGDGYRFLRDDEITGGLQRVDVAGGGCLLVKAKVLDRIAYPYFEPEFRYGTDIQLCRKAAEKGFEVWADTSFELGHLRDKKTIVTSRNRMDFQTGDMVSGEAKRNFIAADVYGRVMQDAGEFTGRHGMANLEEEANRFMDLRKASGLPDAEWYREYPRERVLRQVWFNTVDREKKQMTEFILASIDNHKKLDVLDFGCGIGIPAFTLAEKGHRVTACDIRGTGTLEFLKWRAQKHGASIDIIESEGGPPNLEGRKFDVVIAMDSIEHIEGWRETLIQLAASLKPHGVFFSNNGILENDLHPEHYHIDNKEFISLCMEHGLMPFNQITFVKKEAKHAESTNHQQGQPVHAAAG